MMGRLKSDQGQLFYEFHLGDAGASSKMASPFAATNARREPYLLTALAKVFFEGTRSAGSKGLSSVPNCSSSLDKPSDPPRVQFPN